MNQPQPSMEPKPKAIAPWLLIVFSIVLLGGGGYLAYYYYNQSKTTKSSTTATTITPTTTTKTTDTTKTTTDTTSTTAATSTADWLTFSQTDYPFSFKYPKDWTIDSKKNAAITSQPSIKQYEVVLKSSSGNKYTVYQPSPQSGNETWDLKNAKSITTQSGIKFERKYGSSTDASIKTTLYLANTLDATEINEKSVTIRGESQTLDTTTIGQLDSLVSTFQFTTQ